MYCKAKFWSNITAWMCNKSTKNSCHCDYSFHIKELNFWSGASAMIQDDTQMVRHCALSRDSGKDCFIIWQTVLNNFMRATPTVPTVLFNVELQSQRTKIWLNVWTMQWKPIELINLFFFFQENNLGGVFGIEVLNHEQIIELKGNHSFSTISTAAGMSF